MQSQGVDCVQYFIPPFIIPHLTRFELRNPVKNTLTNHTRPPFLSVLYNKSNLNGLWLNIDFFAAILLYLENPLSMTLNLPYYSVNCSA